MKMWAGRFSKEADARVNDFNSSIRFDSRMVEQDIKGSIAHAQMLVDQFQRPQLVARLDRQRLGLQVCKRDVGQLVEHPLRGNWFTAQGLASFPARFNNRFHNLWLLSLAKK